MSEPHERLNRAMLERGVELRKKWVHIAREAKITTSALSGIRRGEYRPSVHTARALEDALEWEPGSIAAILDGGDPTPLGEGAKLAEPSSDVEDPLEARLREGEELMAEGQRAMAELERAMAELRKFNEERKQEPPRAAG